MLADVFCAIHLVWIQKLNQAMVTTKVTIENQTYCGFQGWLQTEKMATCREQRTHYQLYYAVNKYLLGLLFLLRCTLEPKNELNNFQFFDRKMTRQNLKLGKFMPNQVEITFDHVWWPRVVSTPGRCTVWTRQWNLVRNTRNVFLEKFTKTWWRNYSQNILLKIIISISLNRQSAML